MSNALYGEIYNNHGTAWIFGRRSVGRVIGVPGVGVGDPSGKSSGGRQSRGKLSKADIARLDCMTRGAPQVMVKIVSRTHTAAQLKRHIDYISREGTLELESMYGPLLDTDEVGAVLESWIEHIRAQDAVQEHRRAAISVNLMLSMPQGTDRSQFKQAVLDFVESEFAGRYETLLAFHDDTDKPHAHIAVLSRDDYGKSLNADRDRLDRWRERFATNLRDRGIDADATPRHARGVYTKGLHKTDYHQAAQGYLSKTRHSALKAAYTEIKEGKEPGQQAWQKAIAQRSDAIRVSYESAARELLKSPDSREQEVGTRLEAFVRSMKPPRTRHDFLREYAEKNPEIAEHVLIKFDPNGRGAGQKPNRYIPNTETFEKGLIERSRMNKTPALQNPPRDRDIEPDR